MRHAAVIGLDPAQCAEPEWHKLPFFCYFSSLIGLGHVGQIQVSDGKNRLFYPISAVKTSSEGKFSGVSHRFGCENTVRGKKIGVSVAYSSANLCHSARSQHGYGEKSAALGPICTA
eukprot:5521758-Prymnesium_polylepis.1